ncbi:MAG: hypothetical protein A2848_01990 [Candidatus Magasanikbacteria bacterium RIFCSPHIGHO2_01_FULL_50_8]|uniref:Uncharacterized protein n=2 Tax=Candidatus Magasanikiibacteriota TaxID=1752731 RepID=A0A1F6LN09_9BACT|nr:MAG: hypothetical protein A2848_01990 [Candidatus Magasanikbacteria bacterium RIFCSPHIGHO2_01_FULL_50_8]OGH68125.1 MAG: hypothetical protein A3C15_03390 [Candidatus Magasanikbacteria bacterium RIFCSPHIGHO2_02_FULL_50_9b]
MTKGDFLELIQGEAFKGAVQAAVSPQFISLSDEMRAFRDAVLTREDTTCKELHAMRDELASFSNHVQRVEQHAGIA